MNLVLHQGITWSLALASSRLITPGKYPLPIDIFAYIGSDDSKYASLIFQGDTEGPLSTVKVNPLVLSNMSQWILYLASSRMLYSKSTALWTFINSFDKFKSPSTFSSQKLQIGIGPCLYTSNYSSYPKLFVCNEIWSNLVSHNGF